MVCTYKYLNENQYVTDLIHEFSLRASCYRIPNLASAQSGRRDGVTRRRLRTRKEADRQTRGGKWNLETPPGVEEWAWMGGHRWAGIDGGGHGWGGVNGGMHWKTLGVRK